MSAKILSDEEFTYLKIRLLKDKEDILAKGGTIRTARNRMYGRMTALAGREKGERAYTESQLAEIFEIME